MLLSFRGLQLCALATLCCYGCGGGGGTDAPSNTGPQPFFDAPIPGNTPSFVPLNDQLQTIYDTLRTRPRPTQKSRILVIDTDTVDREDSRQRQHATNVIGALQASSIDDAVTIEYCDIRGTSYANVRACLDHYRMRDNLKVINYSRVLPRDPSLEPSRLPSDAVLVVAAGQTGSISNVQDEVVSALLETGRTLVVSGEMDGGRHREASSCGPSREYCVLADYNWFTRTGGRHAGTSFSATMVSGLAGTARAYWPALTATNTVQLILECARQADGSTGTPRFNTGQGLLSKLDAACVLNPRGSLMIRGYRAGTAGLNGRLLSAGSFSLPALTAYDKYGRDYALQAKSTSLPGRNTLLEGLFDAAAQVHTRPEGQLERGLIEPGRGMFRWHSPTTHTRIFHHLYQATNAESLLVGALYPLGPAQLIAGTTLEHHSFAGGELIGTGQLRIGDSLGWFAGLLMPRRYGTWNFDLQLGALQARMLRPASRSAVRALRARSAGFSLGIYQQPTRNLRLGLRTGCHSGLAGSARLGGEYLPLLARPACKAELQFSLSAGPR